ncbi:conserved hypothetical protein [Neospora caninum Liverpool]|uniref:Uncharacterized protein n=1 Tax=Neospora caninum (strain Liverpool) TaxID=572307 RepID=F0VN38_NEOCL|nr:conserved hypothetical protein [Neospora caninum Liverpool]CBZ55134.1 conserved hypothetical protein [Neospora caninum Liverpool]CEL69860.1 TPA: hypothetical protein BN1204_055590 [Neospora caninum Liverpool]|eukprot:XP_003885162.1 conserved hypothetical protein [Neospora caninum Liverpool]
MERLSFASVTHVDRERLAGSRGREFSLASSVANILAPPSALVEAAVLPCDTFDVFFPRHAHLTVSSDVVAGSPENISARELSAEHVVSEGVCKPEGVSDAGVHRCSQEKAIQSNLEENLRGELIRVPSEENGNQNPGKEWTGVSFDDAGNSLAICQCKERWFYTIALSELARLSRDKRISRTDSRKIAERGWVGWARLALLMNGSSPFALTLAEQRVQQLGEEAQRLISDLSSCPTGSRRPFCDRAENSENEGRRGGEATGTEEDEDVVCQKGTSHLLKTVKGEGDDGTQRRWINAKAHEGSSPEGQSGVHFPDLRISGHQEDGSKKTESSKTLFFQVWEELKEELASVKLLLELHPKCGDLWAYRRFVCRTSLRPLLCLARQRKHASESCSHVGEFQICPKELAGALSKAAPGKSDACSHAVEPVDTPTARKSNVHDPGDSEFQRVLERASIPEGDDKRTCAPEFLQRRVDAAEDHDSVRWLTAELSGFLDTELALVAEHAAQRPHSYQAWEHFAKIEQEMKALHGHLHVRSLHVDQPSADNTPAAQASGRKETIHIGGAKDNAVLEALRDLTMQRLRSFVECQCGLLAHSHAPFHHISKLFEESLCSILLPSGASELLQAEEPASVFASCETADPPASDFPTTPAGPMRAAHNLLTEALKFNAEVLHLFPHLEAPWCGRAELFIAYVRRCSAYANRCSLGTKAQAHATECDSGHPMGPATTKDAPTDQTVANALANSAEKPVGLAVAARLSGNAFADDTAQPCRGGAANLCFAEFSRFTKYFQALWRDEFIWGLSLLQHVGQQERDSVGGTKRSCMVSRWQERHRFRLSQELRRAGIRVPVFDSCMRSETPTYEPD